MNNILKYSVLTILLIGLNPQVKINQSSIDISQAKIHAQTGGCIQCRTAITECIRISSSTGWQFIYYGTQEECEEFPDL
jgi:hypothetical protein